ncbi:MAG: TlpA disulfide reductase family protein [Dehalococcoidia bacterium]|nr:TlpA disulfide reductase family protein [Dehalococcoidia bacterium]
MSSRRILVITVVTIIVGFLSLLGIGLARQTPKTGLSGVYRISKPAIDFTLPLFTGGDITLSKLKGKPVVINFWASWCVPCREEAQAIEKTWRAYKDKGVIFIGVDIQDKEANALEFIKEFNLTYPNGPDIGGKITIDYGVAGIPVTFFVNRDGVIIDRFVGAISERYLVTRIEELLK